MATRKAVPAAVKAQSATQTGLPKDRHRNKISERDQRLGRKA